MAVALVTGSSRGIGRGIAQKFAMDGYDVVINYLNSQDAAEELVGEINDRGNGNAISIQANVSNSDEAEILIERAINHFGGIDHVVNNAGINQHKNTEKLTTNEFNEIMETNTNSAFNITKFVHSHLLDSTVEEGPSIINMSSRLAHVGASFEPHYATSKAGIIGLTKSHAKEFAPNIRVNAIAPGFVKTDMTSKTDSNVNAKERLEEIPLEKLGKPIDIGQAAAYLRDASYVTGETLNVNGGQTMI